MQIKTVTNILSSAHESLADFKSSASENFMERRRHIRGTEKARFATQLAVMYIVSVDLIWTLSLPLSFTADNFIYSKCSLHGVWWWGL